MKTKLDWAKIWDKHNLWWNTELAKEKKCKSCGKSESTDPSWNEQMKAIERIVESYLARKAK